jgi:nucleoid-associated protein YgaU
MIDAHPKKLTVYAFSDKKLQKPTSQFVLPINPENYEQTFKIDYDAKPAQGAQGVEGRFKSSAPEELRLDFMLDETGTVYGYAHKGQRVSEQLDAFKNTVYDLQGKIHQPRYLKLVWKDFTFDCIMSEMKVTFTLFDAEGMPIRAKLSCAFLNYKETERRVREEDKTSPDLTHIRTVTDQDNLPLMTNEVYGVPDYYLEIARANDLTNFRSIETGTTLLFYPLSKDE